MEYCSLEAAFGPQNSEAKKNERRRARRCKGPAQAYIDPQGAYAPDPDRPSVVKQIPPPAMNPSTGLYEHAPTEAEFAEAFQPRTDGDLKGDIVRATLPTNTPGPGELPQSSEKPSFFGKDPTENFASFSHVIGDDKEYRLQPDFQDAFRQVGTLSGAGASSAPLPTPSVRNIWKPLTPSGARTAFFDALPPPGGEVPPTSANNDALHSKLDKLFARLDELEATRAGDSANSQTEVLLFIMSGIFVLFLTDLAVRKGAATF